MPKFDEVLSQNNGQIHREMVKSRRKKAIEIPRNSERRPWSDQLPGAESLREKGVDFTEVKEPPVSKTAAVPAEPTGRPSLFVRYRKEMKAVSALLVVTWLPIGWYAFSIPSQFQSTLQAYAPERSDTISSRLTLFSNRVEFASFPAENKVPVSLLSRRLRQSEARQWVIKKFLESQAAHTENFDPGSVQVETTYIPSSEILVIEAYANNPEASSALATLYWRYFQNLLNDLDLSQTEKVNQWLTLTIEKIDKEIERSVGALQGSAPNTGTTTIVHHVQNTLKENIASSELRRTQILREVDELKRVESLGSIDGIVGLSDSELQNLVDIRKGLSAQKDPSPYYQRIDELESQFKALVQKKLGEKQAELLSLATKRGLFQSQVGRASSEESRLRVASEAQNGLESQLSSLRSQKTELLKFKTQIDLEPHLHSSNIKILQTPGVNAAIERPTTTLRIVTSGLAALTLSLFLFFSFTWALKLRRV